MNSKPSFRLVLSNRSFALLWVGQLVSQSGDFIFDVALLWLVLEITHSVFLVGITMAAVLTPTVIVGPIAGVYVDRLNRKDIMLVSNLFQGILVGVIALLYSTSSLSFPILLLLVLLLNSGAQFFRSSVSAMIPGLVDKQNLALANSLFSISSSMNQLVGYGIGGILILLFGAVLPIYYDALSFFIAFVLISLIARTYGEIPSHAKTLASVPEIQETRSFKDSFVDGLRFIRASRLLVELVVLGVIINFFGGGLATLLAPYAKNLISGNASTYGFLLAVLALGAIVGSVVVGKLNSRKYVGKILFLGLVPTGALVAAMGLVSNVPVALVLALGVGGVLAIVNLPIQVLVQAKVPNELLGRVGSTLGALLTLSQPFAAIVAGSIASVTSVGTTFVLFGSLIMMVAFGLFLVFKELRDSNY